jgi:hypothetical protein
MGDLRDRTWSLTLNLDMFNAALAVQQNDLEHADFVRGFHLGINAGTPRGERSAAFMDGFSVGQTARANTDAYRSMQSTNGKKGGRPKKESGGLAPVNHRLSGAQAPPKLTVTGYVLKDSLSKEELTEGTRTRRKSRKQNPTPEPLEAILGGKGTATFEEYWSLVKVFGAAKNPAPRDTARLFADAVAAGVAPELIQAKAQQLRKAASEAKFMPQLAKWLEGQGYLNPDPTPAAKGTSPDQKQQSIQDYLEANPDLFEAAR